MKKSILVMAFALATVTVFAQAKKPAAATKPAVKTGTTATAKPFKNQIDSVSYSIGLLVAQNLKAQGIANVNLALFQRALTDATQNKKPLLTDEEVKACVMNFQHRSML
jgi:FKBP-type peptidyl-prolyl cis-trans isomerase FklB